MYERCFKRIIDIAISILGLPFFLILYIIFGLLIKLEDGGPIFFKSERVGKGGKAFNMLKFRSMKVNAPNWINTDGSTYNSKDDPRTTKIGRLIRATSIDETPQLLNVLIGEMSIIGPRASLYSGLDDYKDEELDKLKVRPGITGYTQAYYRNGLGWRERRLKDAWYANNVSFVLDGKIFFKTIMTVLKREGLYANHEIAVTNSQEAKETQKSG